MAFSEVCLGIQPGSLEQDTSMLQMCQIACQNSHCLQLTSTITTMTLLVELRAIQHGTHIQVGAILLLAMRGMFYLFPSAA